MLSISHGVVELAAAHVELAHAPPGRSRVDHISSASGRNPRVEIARPIGTPHTSRGVQLGKLTFLSRSPPFPGAGAGVDTRTGVLVCAFEAFIRMRQMMETDPQRQQPRRQRGHHDPQPLPT